MDREEQIIFLCGYFEKKCEDKIRSYQSVPFNYSANNVQERLIRGLKNSSSSLTILSAPFVGSFPKESKTTFFREMDSSEGVQYVSFNNIWGLRNYSRANSLKKRIGQLIENNNQTVRIIVYSTHTPLLEAAVYAKHKNRNVKICLVVPDLPQFNNLHKSISLPYKFGKRIDASHFYRLCKHIDSYLFFASEMEKMFVTSGKRVMVTEGFLDDDIFESNEEKRVAVHDQNGVKYIVYTGTTNEKFGIKDLVDAFRKIEGNNYRLVICGSGDADDYIKKCANIDKRIMALGQISPEESRLWQLKADILVNPRPNDEDFTKYSFPSKNLEYLASGTPVVGYLLDGMPKDYMDYMFCIEDKGNHVDDIRKSILLAIKNPDNSRKYQKFKVYAKKKLLVSSVMSQLLEG